MWVACDSQDWKLEPEGKDDVKGEKLISDLMTFFERSFSSQQYSCNPSVSMNCVHASQSWGFSFKDAIRDRFYHLNAWWIRHQGWNACLLVNQLLLFLKWQLWQGHSIIPLSNLAALSSSTSPLSNPKQLSPSAKSLWWNKSPSAQEESLNAWTLCTSQCKLCGFSFPRWYLHCHLEIQLDFVSELEASLTCENPGCPQIVFGGSHIFDLVPKGYLESPFWSNPNLSFFHQVTKHTGLGKAITMALKDLEAYFCSRLLDSSVVQSFVRFFAMLSVSAWNSRHEKGFCHACLGSFRGHFFGVLKALRQLFPNFNLRLLAKTMKPAPFHALKIRWFQAEVLFFVLQVSQSHPTFRSWLSKSGTSDAEQCHKWQYANQINCIHLEITAYHAIFYGSTLHWQHET